MSALSEKWLFNFRIFSGGYPDPKAEVRFHVTRKYTLDYAFLDKMIAVEIEGGQWTRGRHTRGIGYASDCEKYNLAQSMGWKVFRFSTSMIEQRKYYLPLFRTLGISEKEKA